MTRPQELEVVVTNLVTMGVELRGLDDEISRTISTIEQHLRELRVNRIFSIKLPDGADLGWSLNRRTRRWRFVIRDEDSAVELLSCTADERSEVFDCGAMSKLIAQILESV